MPAIAKTTRSDIILTARTIVEELGVDSLTMVEVAKRVGIRGPSLYKHFSDRTLLLREVETETFRDLGRTLAQATQSIDALAEAYVGFARRHPARYGLLFSMGLLDDAEAVKVRTEAARPVFAILAQLLGNEHEALLRARVITSFLHGYVSMEAAGAYRLGGTTDGIVSAGLAFILPEVFKRDRPGVDDLRGV
jgi:AcrR family transcriptional regulator